MNKEKVLERIELLKKDSHHHNKMLNMIEGAIQDCNHWLNELDLDSNMDNKNDE